jgi:hypothetical protein
VRRCRSARSPVPERPWRDAGLPARAAFVAPAPYALLRGVGRPLRHAHEHRRSWQRPLRADFRPSLFGIPNHVCHVIPPASLDRVGQVEGETVFPAADTRRIYRDGHRVHATSE